MFSFYQGKRDPVILRWASYVARSFRVLALLSIVAAGWFYGWAACAAVSALVAAAAACSWINLKIVRVLHEGKSITFAMTRFTTEDDIRKRLYAAFPSLKVGIQMWLSEGGPAHDLGLRLPLRHFHDLALDVWAGRRYRIVTAADIGTDPLRIDCFDVPGG